MQVRSLHLQLLRSVALYEEVGNPLAKRRIALRASTSAKADSAKLVETAQLELLSLVPGLGADLCESCVPCCRGLLLIISRRFGYSSEPRRHDLDWSASTTRRGRIAAHRHSSTYPAGSLSSRRWRGTPRRRRPRHLDARLSSRWRSLWPSPGMFPSPSRTSVS